MSKIRTFRTVFRNSYFFAVEAPGKIGTQNIVFVGYNSNKIIDFNDSEIAQNENQIIRSLVKRVIDLDRFEFSKYPILTDNFSPVEYLTAEALLKGFSQQKFIDGNEMLALVDQQLRYGPRYLSTPGHKSMQKFLIAEMNTLAAETRVQVWQHMGTDGQKHELKNIIGRLYPENKKRIMLATHYDSKRFAAKDLHRPDQPVPGANDSASGVAVLLELVRVLANLSNTPSVGVDIVFFDGEAGDERQGGDYEDRKPIGSTYFTEHLGDIYGDNKPISGIVLNAVCGQNFKIVKEQSSVKNASAQVEKFWSIAAKIDKNVFLDQVGPEIKGDHTPFNHVSIPVFLVMDSQYPSFHTTKDTLDKCSAKSLEIVTKAVLNYAYLVR